MAIKKIILIQLMILFFAAAHAGNKIKYYFNQPVDTMVATGEKALYLNNCIADTLVAYLNKARYSLDICMYDFEKTYSYNIGTLDTQFAPRVAAAIDSAYARGVTVRYIYEASNANNGLSLLDTPNIHTLGSPQGSNYTIMHNKFVIIDAKSPNPNDPIVWTGCLNWYYEQFNWDYNNVVTLQDSALAQAYTAEFNMMWGSTGPVPNKAHSKFGMYKTDLGLHTFHIDGNLVELYFSPSDGTDNHIQSAISSANTDLYFGEYTFTDNTDANLIMTQYNNGVYVAGIDDSYSNSYGPYSTFTSGLGSNFKVYTETDTTLYHNKFLIVDPSDTCSDPLVLTGSHNWSISANTHNDENTIIIHNATAANLYYQYFKASFNSLGGTLTPQNGCSTANVNASETRTNNFSVYPNPSDGDITIGYQLSSAQEVSITVYDVTGRLIALLVNDTEVAGVHTVNWSIRTPGMYFVRFAGGKEVRTKKLIVSK